MPEPGTLTLSGEGSYEVTTNAVLMATDTLESGDEIEGETLTGEVTGESDTVEYFGSLESIDYSGDVEVDATPVNEGEDMTVEDAITIFYANDQNWNYVPGFNGWSSVSEYSEDKVFKAITSVPQSDSGDIQWIANRSWFDKSNVRPENRTFQHGINWPDAEPASDVETTTDSSNDSESTSNPDVDLGEFAPDGEDYTGDSGAPALPVPDNLIPDTPIEDIRRFISERDWLMLFAIAAAVVAGFFISANLLGRSIGIRMGKVLRNA